MKKYKIKYQKGSDILIENIQANDVKEAMYLFYMTNRNTDILDIEEV